jgi:hypothetical protein
MERERGSLYLFVDLHFQGNPWGELLRIQYAVRLCLEFGKKVAPTVRCRMSCDVGPF